MAQLVKDLEIPSDVDYIDGIENWWSKNDEIGGGMFTTTPKEFKEEYADNYVYSANKNKNVMEVFFGNREKS